MKNRFLLCLAALVGAPCAFAQDSATLTAPDGTILGPGAAVRIYDINQRMETLPVLVEGQTPNVSKTTPTIDLRGSVDDDGDFGIRDRFFTEVDAFLRVETPGQYTLRLISDDGSKLYLGDRLLIDHDGLHSSESKDATVELAAGLHAIKLLHFDNTHDARLRLEWKAPGASSFEVVPQASLWSPADEVKVTSPGPKKVLDLDGRSLLRPGDGAPLDGVHPAYTLTPLHYEAQGPDGFEPRVGGIDFLSDGRMVMCTWDGDVFILDNVASAKGPQDLRIRKFATGLAEPLGVCIVDDGIYVLQKQELTQLIDHDNDGVADEYRCVGSGWPVTSNFHEFAFGPVYKDGYFYFNLATAIDPGGASTRPQVVGRGTCIQLNPQTGEYEYIAGGLRTPNGIGLGPDGEIFVADNQGDWLPSSKIVHIRPGRHYGNHLVPAGPFDDQPETKPVVWLPQGEIGNSPSQIVMCQDGPYKGQLLHGDVTHGGLKRVFLDEVDGEYQGAVFRFTQGLTGGVNRVAYGPDGGLYVGGIGSGGNWGQTGKKKFGLERLNYTGAPAFEMLAVRAMSNGFEITFTEPLAQDYAPRPEHFVVEHWWYEPTPSYGGPKKDVTPVFVKSVTLADDRRTLFLEMDDVAAGPVKDGVTMGRVYHFRLTGRPRSEGGRDLWSTEAWYTLNRVPSDRVGRVDPVKLAVNELTEEEKQGGWRLLFDGKTTQGWRGFRRQDMPDGWQVHDGALARVGGGGDIVTVDQFDSFELTLEWKVGEGGNSGIFYRVGENDNPSWRTGPEMQVLDNDRHGDGRNARTSAGSLYALIAPAADVTRPVGQWNEVRILVDGNHVEHWMNGQKLLEYEWGSPELKALIADSKFRDMPNFATLERGHICLQDHGDPVWFRNIKIREIKRGE